MNKIPFQDGTKVSNAKVTIDGTDYNVTPAQYTGTTPLTAYNLNLLQDRIEDAIDEINSYSTSEKQIGTWNNEKPLYRKTFDVTSSTTIYTQLGTDITIRRMYGTAAGTNNNVVIPLPYVTVNSSTGDTKYINFDCIKLSGENQDTDKKNRWLFLASGNFTI